MKNKQTNLSFLQLQQRTSHITHPAYCRPSIQTEKPNGFHALWSASDHRQRTTHAKMTYFHSPSFYSFANFVGQTERLTSRRNRSRFLGAACLLLRELWSKYWYLPVALYGMSGRCQQSLARSVTLDSCFLSYLSRTSHHRRLIDWFIRSIVYPPTL